MYDENTRFIYLEYPFYENMLLFDKHMRLLEEKEPDKEENKVIIIDLMPDNE